MKSVMIGFAALMYFMAAFAGQAKADTPYTEYQRALKECTNSLKTLSQSALTLRRELKQLERVNRAVNDPFVGQDPRPLTRTVARQWATEFKEPNLEFNRKIKLYQNKCKRVEAMIRGKLILGE